MSSCTCFLRSSASVWSPWILNGSPMIEPIVLRGFSDAYGSWKIICISRRSGLSLLCGSMAMSSPSKRMVPLVGSSSRISSRAVVLFPQPLSPTMPSVSPRITSNETPSTARTAPYCFWKITPWVSGKCLTRSRTSTSGSPLSVPGSTAALAATLIGDHCHSHAGPSCRSLRESLRGFSYRLSFGRRDTLDLLAHGRRLLACGEALPKRLARRRLEQAVHEVVAVLQNRLERRVD